MFDTQPERAIERGEEALQHAEEAGHLKFQAEVLTGALTYAHLQLDDLESAMASVERGMEIATRIGDHESVLLAAIAQGKVAMAQGYYGDAMALFRRAEAASQQTGLPFFAALGRCVTGTCYSSIGGALREQALEIHAEALAMAEGPLGDVLGTWVWSEVGMCALDAGKVGAAEEMFEKALRRQTMAMNLKRPDALAGMCEVAIDRGDVGQAETWAAELREHVEERGIRSAERPLMLAEGRVAAASGDHERALEHFDRLLDRLDGLDFLRDELDVQVQRIESFEAIGDRDGVREARESFQRVMEEILPRIGDDHLRVAFSEGALDMLPEIRA